MICQCGTDISFMLWHSEVREVVISILKEHTVSLKMVTVFSSETLLPIYQTTW
jgi:hypothetical protein